MSDQTPLVERVARAMCVADEVEPDGLVNLEGYRVRRWHCYLETARAALTALGMSRQQQDAPAGEGCWVPVVPTRGMLKAAHEAECVDAALDRPGYDTVREENEHVAGLFYRTMLSSRPGAAQEGEA